MVLFILKMNIGEMWEAKLCVLKLSGPPPSQITKYNTTLVCVNTLICIIMMVCRYIKRDSQSLNATKIDL